MGLNVRIRSTEELLGPLDSEVFRDIDEFATTVVALTGITLRVLVGQNAALGFQDGVGNKVLAGNHFQGAALAT